MPIRQLTALSLLGFAVLLARPAEAQQSFSVTKSQYVADWSQDPGFKLSGAMWDPGASFNIVYGALPPTLISTITAANNAQSYAAYQGAFQNVLKNWALAQETAAVRGSALITATVAFLNQTYANTKAQLAQQYPGYPDAVYQALMIQNLVHGYHVYATSSYYETVTGQFTDPSDLPILQNGQLTMSDELASLLETPVADCGEITELVRVLGRIWGLDVRYVGVSTDYWSPLANAEVAAGAHALNILVYANGTGVKSGLLLDATVNIAFAPGPLSAILPGEMTGDGIIAASSSASTRYSALAAKGKVLQFFDYYMHPPVRAGYLKAGQFDASLEAYMYAYFLEEYPKAARVYSGATGWQVNNSSYSLNQPLY